MANVYLEARSNDGSKQASTQLCVVSNFADQLLGTFRNRKEATEWARAMGYVQLRRGILDHLREGRLMTQEYAVFTVLLLLADSSTGGGVINAPLLAYWMANDISQDAAARTLQSLARKKYIWYRSCRTKQAQPYFIDGYLLTSGDNKSRMLNLSQLYDRSTISVADVLQAADVLRMCCGSDADVLRMSCGSDADEGDDRLAHTLRPEPLHRRVPGRPGARDVMGH